MDRLAIGETVRLAHPVRVEGVLLPRGTSGTVVSLHRLHARVALLLEGSRPRVARIEREALEYGPPDRTS
jgi:hypothetical protein